MHRYISTRTFCALVLATSILVGCGFPAPTSDNPDTEDAAWPLQVLSDRPAEPPVAGQYTETEPNDAFTNAEVVANDSIVDLLGGIAAGSSPADMDIYRLRGGDTGDRVQVTLTIRSGYDLVLGLLDDRQRLLSYADPGSVVNGPKQIDIVLHEPTSELIAIVAARSSSSSDRLYTARVTMQPAAGIPPYQPQVVVLNFDGGDAVKIGRRSPVYVPPFDAAAIDPRFTGQTETIIDLIVQAVREDYAGLGVEVYASGDPSIPAGSVSSVYFGTYNSALLGLADNVDPYNTQPDQSAILFTDTFRLFNVFNPSAADIAQVLANVASHESGHLLGLRHTADVIDLMDITASARQMLSDQWFRNATIHPTVLPTGSQDAPALLEWTLGGTLIGPPAGKVVNLQRHAATLNDPSDFHIPHGLLGTCGDEIDNAATDDNQVKEMANAN